MAPGLRVCPGPRYSPALRLSEVSLHTLVCTLPAPPPAGTPLLVPRRAFSRGPEGALQGRCSGASGLTQRPPSLLPNAVLGDTGQMTTHVESVPVTRLGRKRKNSDPGISLLSVKSQYVRVGGKSKAGQQAEGVGNDLTRQEAQSGLNYFLILLCFTR